MSFMNELSIDVGGVAQRWGFTPSPLDINSISETRISVKLQSGEAISGHTPVHVGQEGKLYASNNIDTASCLMLVGVTLNASILGSWTDVVTDGIIIHNGWSWVSDAAVYVGNGVLTQTVPTSGAIAIVGYAADATTIIVKPQNAILI